MSARDTPVDYIRTVSGVSADDAQVRERFVGGTFDHPSGSRNLLKGSTISVVSSSPGALIGISGG
jgi:hypothetical protein